MIEKGCHLYVTLNSWLLWKPKCQQAVILVNLTSVTLNETGQNVFELFICTLGLINLINTIIYAINS